MKPSRVEFKLGCPIRKVSVERFGQHITICLEPDNGAETIALSEEQARVLCHSPEDLAQVVEAIREALKAFS